MDYAGAVTGDYHYLNIDANLYILETTTEIDAQGLRTVALTVATVDAWPTSEAELIADEMASGPADGGASATDHRLLAGGALHAAHG